MNASSTSHRSPEVDYPSPLEQIARVIAEGERVVTLFDTAYANGNEPIYANSSIVARLRDAVADYRHSARREEK